MPCEKCRVRGKECAAAGVEYIERPVSAEELAELRKDSERLNAMISMVGENQIVGIEKQDEEWLLSKYDDADAAPTFVWKCCGDTTREAIDAAMKGGV